jgi:hypothetical protein
MKNKKIQKYIALTSMIVMLALLNRCALVGVNAKYSFDGASISPDVKTCWIMTFQNRAPQIQPKLSQDLTEKLRQKIQSQTRLKITNGGGDAVFEGYVSDYSTKPMAAQGGATINAQLNRLTVNIHVRFSNSKDSKLDFEQDFSRYFDYKSELNLSDVENGTEFTKLEDELIDDVYNKAFVNW